MKVFAVIRLASIIGVTLAAAGQWVLCAKWRSMLRETAALVLKYPDSVQLMKIQRDVRNHIGDSLASAVVMTIIAGLLWWLFLAHPGMRWKKV